MYRHPGHVVLFDRSRIIKYKKGPLAARRLGLEELRRDLAVLLGAGTPRLKENEALVNLVGSDLTQLGGRSTKAYEDSLDAVLCAYLAAHYWAWGDQRNEMIGTMEGSYIIVPTTTSGGIAWSHGRG